MSEILLILAALLLLFGATRLPQLGSSLGQAIRNFKKGFSQEDEGQGSGETKPSQHLTGAQGSPSNPAREGQGKPLSKES
jgi:sec-independent protein translocase protein TatA